MSEIKSGNIEWHSNPYLTCPDCEDEWEVMDGENIVVECDCDCGTKIRYSTTP